MRQRKNRIDKRRKIKRNMKKTMKKSDLKNFKKK